jgi:hypothetical protein
VTSEELAAIRARVEIADRDDSYLRSYTGASNADLYRHPQVRADMRALLNEVARLTAEVERLRGELAEARCDALEERMTTADVPWRVHGCQCPADSKPGDRCDHRWSRCNGRLQWLKARKVTGEGR